MKLFLINGVKTHLIDLLDYKDDTAFLDKLAEVKKEHKIYLAGHIKRRSGFTIDPNSLYDIQVKRIHSYKRQIMNILHVMHIYNLIKANYRYALHVKYS